MRVGRGDLLDFSKAFDDGHALLFELPEQLDDDFGVGVTVEADSWEVVDFDIGVVADDTVVDQVDGVGVVVVGVGVLGDFFSAGGPSGVSDADMGPDDVLGDLLDHSFDAVHCGLLGVGMLDDDGG